MCSPVSKQLAVSKAAPDYGCFITRIKPTAQKPNHLQERANLKYKGKRSTLFSSKPSSYKLSAGQGLGLEKLSYFKIRVPNGLDKGLTGDI